MGEILFGSELDEIKDEAKNTLYHPPQAREGMMFKAKIVVDGANEAEVSGTDKTTVLSQAALYFSQYTQDFEYEIRLEVINDK